MKRLDNAGKGKRAEMREDALFCARQFGLPELEFGGAYLRHRIAKNTHHGYILPVICRLK